MLLVRHSSREPWHCPKVTAFSEEADLQLLVKRAPDLLPGGDAAMAVVTEMTVPQVGSADIVAVDMAGAVTIVECKLKANSEIRRQVVGQIFAYAAGLSGMAYETFDALFSGKSGTPLAEQVRAVTTEGDGWNEEAFRSQVADNLRHGRFRLVIAVDEITDELKLVVRYLNAHTVPEIQVLALELHYVADDGVEILVPATYGLESTEGKDTGTQKRKWDESTVLGALERCCTSEGYHAANTLYEFAKQRGAGVNFGYGVLPSATIRLPVGGKPVSVLSFYEWPLGRGVVAINFEYLLGYADTDALTRLADQLRTIPEAAQYLQGLETAGFKRRPGLPINEVLAQPGAVMTIENAITELRQTPAT